MSNISWSADTAGILPGGRCHTSGDAVVQWAVWHDVKGRRCQRVLNVDGDLPDTFQESRPLSPAELAYGRELATRIP